MLDDSELLSKLFDVEQFIKTDMQENNGTQPVIDENNNNNHWYATAAAAAAAAAGTAAGTAQWYGAHLANNFAPIQIIPYQHLLTSGLPTSAPPPVAGFRQYPPEIPANSGSIHPRYLYILNASTSPATKFNEETITFLNQGQSYEIQLLCPENPDNFSALKSVIRVSFNDRRLQFMEKEQLEMWKQERHPTEKLIELDIPLCDGVTSIKGEVSSLNSVEFLWDCRQRAALSFKLNCVSTEFTVKKCGGEKGIPLRVQIDTYGPSASSSSSTGAQHHQQHHQPPRLTKLLHSAYCLVKVFKPKGAERKLKNDLEWLNRLLSENKKGYRPSQDKTILIELPVEEIQRLQTRNNSTAEHQTSFANNCLQNPIISTTDLHPTGLNNSTELENCRKSNSKPGSHSTHNVTLTSQMTQAEVVQWMKTNQFDNFISVLSRFTGSDLLRLSRKDFIEICGVAEGVRFNNAVRNRPIRPKLSIYVSIQTTDSENDLTFRDDRLLERHGSVESFVLSPVNSIASSPSGPGPSLAQSLAYSSLSPSLASSFPSSLDGEIGGLQPPGSMKKKKKRALERSVEDLGSPAVKRCRSQMNLTANVYNLVTLDSLTRPHLVQQLSGLCGLHTSQVVDIYLQNSKGIIVEVTNLVIENFEEEAHFKLELLPGDSVDVRLRPVCVLLLKTVSSNSKHMTTVS